MGATARHRAQAVAVEYPQYEESSCNGSTDAHGWFSTTNHPGKLHSMSHLRANSHPATPCKQRLLLFYDLRKCRRRAYGISPTSNPPASSPLGQTRKTFPHGAHGRDVRLRVSAERKNEMKNLLARSTPES
jgi:hypothetical protein